MSGLTLFGFTILKSQTEREILNLFQHYEKTLSDQKLKMSNDINEWGEALMRTIYKYVKKQKDLLEQEYANKTRYLNNTCQQSVEELRVQEQLNNTEQINQLLNKCQALKFELDALEYKVESIRFIEVPTKQRMVMNQDESDVIETENNKLNINSTITNNNEAEDNMDTHLKLNQSMSSTNAKETNQQSFTIKISHDDDRSTIYRNDMLEECSTCFMAFPSNMPSSDRLAHVNGHFTNN